MNAYGGRAIGLLLTLGLVLGTKYGCRVHNSREVRAAAYKRYAELGTPDEVKAVVDRYHDAAFEHFYKMGGRRQSSEFDVESYAKEMDRDVERELRVSANQRVRQLHASEAAVRQEAAAARQQAAATPAAPVTGPHSVQIQSVDARAMTADEMRGMPGRGFHLRATVFDEADDVRNSPPPQGYVEVTCQGRRVLERATTMPTVASQGGHTSSVETSFSVAGDGPDFGPACLATLTLTDAAGNRSGAFPYSLAAP